MKFKEIVKFILVILIFIVGAYFVIDSIKNNAQNFSSPYDCKIYWWKECGLKVYENESLMCYQLEENNKSRWENCQVVSNETKNCWEEKYNFCINLNYSN